MIRVASIAGVEGVTIVGVVAGVKGELGVAIHEILIEGPARRLADGLVPREELQVLQDCRRCRVAGVRGELGVAIHEILIEGLYIC